MTDLRSTLGAWRGSLARLVRRIRRLPVCEEPGCCNKPELFEIESDEFWLCYDHAGQHGFCWSCGGFFAGCWEFDTHPTGLCLECDEQLKADTGYYDEEEEPWP